MFSLGPELIFVLYLFLPEGIHQSLAMHQQQALITFVKNPKKGKVKTRLARTVGDDRALQIYKALLQHTRDICTSINASRYLYYSNFIDEQDEWPNELFQKELQPTGDLGNRMATAFQQVLRKHQKAVIIGSDCASLTSGIVEEAFRQLEDHDFVLGPAFDGGYYLLGMRTFLPVLFEDMPWSTESVADITRQRILDAQKSFSEVATLSDIDYEEDWEKYGWELS